MKTIAQQINWDIKANGELVIRDKNGNRIYYENLDGWIKREYDSQGQEIYYEDSFGEITDNRPKTNPELTLESLAEQVLKLSEILTRFVNQSIKP